MSAATADEIRLDNVNRKTRKTFDTTRSFGHEYLTKMPQSRLMRPLVVLAIPGMYLFYKYNQYKRQQQEQHRRRVTEKELQHLNQKIDKLLTKLDDHEGEAPETVEDECVICLGAKATMQTQPCGHRVVCRKCFVKTIQVAVTQRCLPLRCVICRARILKLKQQSSRIKSFMPSFTRHRVHPK
ncbi:uncharacterized protein LOC141912174 [Tubulanus polymorphus]|uniref:uncharacterized protein LOC141912174 n=1 Tax=Tubulanus polymorphus TaxID=672921 RepID=UPI003DA24B8E